MYLTDKNYVEIKCGERQIFTIICVTYVHKNFLDANFNEAVIGKI